MPARPRPPYALAEMERLNAEALAALTGRHNVKLARFRQLLRGGAPAGGRRAGRARRTQRGRAQDPRFLSAFRDRTAAWSRISIKAVLEAREG